MILPIYLYGQPVLRKATEEVTEGELDLKQLIADTHAYPKDYPRRTGAEKSGEGIIMNYEL